MAQLDARARTLETYDDFLEMVVTSESQLRHIDSVLLSPQQVEELRTDPNVETTGELTTNVCSKSIEITTTVK